MVPSTTKECKARILGVIVLFFAGLISMVFSIYAMFVIHWEFALAVFLFMFGRNACAYCGDRLLELDAMHSALEKMEERNGRS